MSYTWISQSTYDENVEVYPTNLSEPGNPPVVSYQDPTSKLIFNFTNFTYNPVLEQISIPLSSMPNGSIITMKREDAEVKNFDPENGDTIDADGLQEGVDKSFNLTTQQFDRYSLYSIKIKEGDAFTTNPANRAGRLAIFDNEGYVIPGEESADFEDAKYWAQQAEFFAGQSEQFKNEAEQFRNEAEQFKNEAEAAARWSFVTTHLTFLNTFLLDNTDPWFISQGADYVYYGSDFYLEEAIIICRDVSDVADTGLTITFEDADGGNDYVLPLTQPTAGNDPAITTIAPEQYFMTNGKKITFNYQKGTGSGINGLQLLIKGKVKAN